MFEVPVQITLSALRFIDDYRVIDGTSIMVRIFSIYLPITKYRYGSFPRLEEHKNQ